MVSALVSRTKLQLRLFQILGPARNAQKRAKQENKRALGSELHALMWRRQRRRRKREVGLFLVTTCTQNSRYNLALICSFVPPVIVSDALLYWATAHQGQIRKSRSSTLRGEVESFRRFLSFLL
jgi:hypothetical protein